MINLLDDNDKSMIATIVRSNCQVSISHNFSIMFRSGGTTWLLVFIGLIFVAVITKADQNLKDLYPDYPDDDIPDECKDEDEEYEYSYDYDDEEAGSNNLSVIIPEGKVLE